MQSIFSFEDKQLTLLGKFLILGKLYLTGISFTDWSFPISRFLKSVVLDVSIFEIGKCHNKSNIVLIFFLKNNCIVLLPIPLILSKGDNKYS